MQMIVSDIIIPAHCGVMLFSDCVPGFVKKTAWTKAHPTVAVCTAHLTNYKMRY